MKWYLLIFICALGCVSACNKQKKYSNIPFIEFQGIYPDSIKAGASEDTVFISFRFTDGDADLGNDPQSGQYDIFLTDLRDNTEYNYFFPALADLVRNPDRGMEGNCTFYVLGAFLALRPDHPDRDTVQFSLYIRDQAGNKSNTVYTHSVYLIP